MASKKSAVAAGAQAQDVPALLTTAERNKYLGRVKASLAKTWSLSRADTISGATHLAWFYVALGRDAEARALVDLVADGGASLAGADKATSVALAMATALAARLARLANDDARRSSLFARLGARSPAAAPGAPNAPTATTTLADAEKDVRSAEVDPSQKHACQGFAQGCARAAYVREAAGDGLDAEASDAVERIIAQGLDGLRAQLSR